jgi:hypothetical protein
LISLLNFWEAGNPCEIHGRCRVSEVLRVIMKI